MRACKIQKSEVAVDLPSGPTAREWKLEAEKLMRG